MPPLPELLKRRLTTAIKCGPPGVWKALIVDERSRELLESVYTLFDVLQMNITSVDPLMSPRAPQPTLDAVYILTPTTQNVQRVIADFQGRKTYRTIHLYFIDGISDRLAEQLTNAIPEDVLQSFVELYCNFWAIESQVFSFKTPESFFTLFGNPGGMVAAELAHDRFEEDVRLLSRNVLNLLTTLGENPFIRYYSPSHHPPLGALSQSSTPGSLAPPSAISISTPEPGPRWKTALSGLRGQTVEFGGDQICKRLAMEVQRELDEYKALNPEFPPETDVPRPRAVLFVLDRSVDPVAPFLHEFTYQAMVNDLLPIEDGTTYKYKIKSALGGIENKTAILSDADKIWTEVRHMHMKEAIDKLMNDFNSFTKEHAGFRSNENATSLDDMKDMLASLPQFQEMRDKFSLHLDMAQECMSLFEQKKLAQTANVEQCCATGVTPEGKTPKGLVEEMVPLLDDRHLSNRDKIRIIALYILHRDGVPDEDRKRLFQHARLSLSEQEAVNNLVYLGAKVVKTTSDRITKPRLKPKNLSSEEEYELSRYKPLIKQIVEDQVNNRLDVNLFPYVRDAPVEATLPPNMRSANSQVQPGSSLRTARPTWHKAPSTRIAAATEQRQRIILFVAGGITYSEQRMAYLVGKALKKEVIIGSTHQLSPETYINDLKALGRAGVGGQPPNARQGNPVMQQAARSPGSGRRINYQTVIDSRIWYEPIGPPPIAPPPPPPGATPQPGLKTQSSFFSGRSSSPASTTLSKTSDTFSLRGKKDKEKKDKDKEKKDKDKDKYREPTGVDEGGKKKSGLFKMRWD